MIMCNTWELLAHLKHTYRYKHRVLTGPQTNLHQLQKAWSLVTPFFHFIKVILALKTFVLFFQVRLNPLTNQTKTEYSLKNKQKTSLKCLWSWGCNKIKIIVPERSPRLLFALFSCWGNNQHCLSTEKQIATALWPNVLSFCPNDFMLRVAEMRENLSGKKGQ